MSHLHFKVYASVLARVIRRLLPNGGVVESRLGEKMITIANIHVSSVVSGKTVDEIVKIDAKRKNKQDQNADVIKERTSGTNGDENVEKELPYYIREMRHEEATRPNVHSTFLARLRCAQKKNLLHFR